MAKLLNNSYSTVILFDIDYTLFDANKFRRKVFKIIKNKVVDRKIKNIDAILRKGYIISRKDTGYFNLKIFLDHVATRFKMGFSVKKLEKELLREDLLAGNLYQEAKKVLRVLSKNNSLKIGIFSAGEIFQRKKLKEVENFLNKDHIHIFTVKKHKELPSIIKRYKNYKLYIVDDMLKILRLAKMFNKSVFTIWIKRKKFARKAEEIADFVPDATITNLREVTKLV